jgi:tetratricopeptide (TPR) repeat protein
MIRLIAFILTLLLPLTGLAEPVPVRSGDHADFSRLLLPYDGGLEWSFGRVDGGYEFRPSRPDLDWDLRRTFDRITRARIRDLRDLGEGRLFLSVTCDCHADAFVLRDGEVVLDIKDGPAPPIPSPFEARLADIDRVSPDPDHVAPALGPRLPGSTDGSSGSDRSRASDVGNRAGLPLTIPNRSGAANAFSSGSSVPASAPRTHEAGIPLETVVSVLPESGVNPPVRSRVAETESALIEQIARAAAQGLIDADMSRIENDVRAATNPLENAEPEPVRPSQLPDPAPSVTPRGHISIETGVDRAVPAAQTGQTRTDDGARCIDPVLFDISSWGGSMKNGADIGSYRSRLVGEFDIANGEGVTNLARHYLYITFGAETKALLSQFPSDVVRPDLLVAMAEIMDRGKAETAMAFVDQMPCDGSTALWATLAQPQLYRGQSINTAAVTLSFAGLPPHLRRHLGPGLAEKFLGIEDIETAERIRNAIARGAGDGPELDLLSARLDLASGDRKQGTEILDQVVSQDTDVLASALLDRVEAALSHGEAVAPDQIALLRSLAFERQGRLDGPSLVDAEVRARAASGDFEAALARLEQAETEALLPEGRSAPLTAEVYLAFSRDAADPTFLRLAVPRFDRALKLPTEERRAIAARFLDLGFSEPARRVLGGEGAVPEKADRLLFARAALMEGRPDVAVGYLAGLVDGEAARLRAQAFENAGDFAGAAQAFDKIGEESRGTRSAWLGGIWTEVAGRDAGAMARAASLMTGAPPPRPTMPESGNDVSAVPPLPDAPGAPAEMAPLARSRSLVDDSRATRAVLDALLSTIPTPPTDLGS